MKLYVWFFEIVMLIEFVNEDELCESFVVGVVMGYLVDVEY